MACIDLRVTRNLGAKEEGDRVSYSIEYRATCNRSGDGPQVISQHFNFPIVNQTTFNWGFNSDPDAICRSIGNFRRGQSGKSGNFNGLGDDGAGLYYWIFTADFSWERENDPTKQAPTVTPFFIDTVKPAVSAEFLDFVDGAKATKGINNPDFLVNSTMPVCNSAQTPTIPAPEIRTTSAGYRVNLLVKTWTDLKPYINKTNSESATIGMRDYGLFRSINGPIMFQKTFEPKTLLLANVQTSVVTIYDRRWFDLTIEYLEGDWNHYELDRGIVIRPKNGDPDGRGGTYSASDFASGQPRIARVLGANGQPVSDPVLFDGLGKPLTNPKPSDAIYLKFGMYQATSFAGLNQLGFLGVY